MLPVLRHLQQLKKLSFLILGFLSLQACASQVASTKEESEEQSGNAVAVCNSWLQKLIDRVKELEIRSVSYETDMKIVKLSRIIAECENTLGHYENAERYYRQALTFTERLSGPTNVTVAQECINVAAILVYQNKYKEAKELYFRAMSIGQKLGTDGQSITAHTLSNLGTVSIKLANYEEAHDLYSKSLKIWTSIKDNGKISTLLTHLGVIAALQGKNNEAEKMLEQAVSILNKIQEDQRQHSDVNTILRNAAFISESIGDYPAAESVYRKLLKTHSDGDGEQLAFADDLNGLAHVLCRQGKYDQAEQRLLEALNLRLEILGSKHPLIADSFNNLAFVFEHIGRKTEAEVRYRDALALRRQVLAPDHPQIAESLNNLAGLLLYEQGRQVETVALLRQALEIRRKKFEQKHPYIAQSLGNLAIALDIQNNDTEAEGLYRQSLKIRKEVLGENHPDVATSQINLGLFLARKKAPTLDVQLFVNAMSIREAQLRTATSEVRSQALLEAMRPEEEALYGLLLFYENDDYLKSLALGTAFLRKGRAADAGAAANALLHNKLGNVSLRQSFELWQSLRQMRESLLYSGAGSLSTKEHQAKLKDLQLKIDDLEHLLLLDLPELRSIQPSDFAKMYLEVAKQLRQKNGVLIEVVLGTPIVPVDRQTAPTQKYRAEPHYIAFVVFPDERFGVQDLGKAIEVDHLVQNFAAALENPASNALLSAQALYRQILAPILPRIAGMSNLFLSLDGTLNLVPFAALHDGKDYLLGRYQFHYLTSGRDLLREASKQAPNPALVIADPDFGQARPEGGSLTTQSRSLYQRLGDLSRLPGGRNEGTRVASLLGVKALLDRQAREEVVRTVRSPFIVHIATHGLFLNDRELAGPALGDTRAVNLLSAARTLRTKNVSGPSVGLPKDAPLLLPTSGHVELSRSALVLAGAAENQSGDSAARDGLLTADEARSLDLNGTQLVVLSACETGKGALSAGQGVYGLRRAFLVAGAETLVTSLWRVHDDATGELMGMYYRRLLEKQKPADRLGAMVEAMQELRSKPGRSHPYYWAPFLVIGQDGPLRPPAVQKP